MARRALGTRKTAPSTPSALHSGARAEFVDQISFYEARYTRLAEAVPADKYNWRPAEGVRSIGEVFAHSLAANYGIARAFGTPPAGVDFKVIGAAAGDKAKTVQGLKDSFAHFRKAILALSDADVDKRQKMFGRETTQRGALFMVTGHMGEHLGQSIAYARMNGICSSLDCRRRAAKTGGQAQALGRRTKKPIVVGALHDRMQV